ncbi:MAG: DMT family transporter [Phycisphaerae bacterium]|jgi:drug/metabolite transporter (DMT)-like permease
MSRQRSTITRFLLDHFSGKGLCAITLWGASFVMTRVALDAFTPFGLVAFRMLAAGVVLLAVARVRSGRMLPRREDVGICVFLGVVLSLHLLMQAYGLQYTTAINAGWIIGFIPVTIAIGAHLLGKQRINREGWTGVLVGAGGVLLVTSATLHDFERARFGDLWQVLSCLTWTVYTLAGVDAIRRSGALHVTALAMSVAAVLTLASTCRTGFLHDALSLKPFVSVLCLGFLCSGLAYYLWFQAVTEHGPTRTGSLLYLEPFVTLIAATITLHEPVSINVLFGGLCVLSGVWLVAKGSRVPIAK